MTRKQLKQLIRESIEEVMNEAPETDISSAYSTNPRVAASRFPWLRPKKDILSAYSDPANFSTYNPRAMLLVSDAGYVVAEFTVEPSDVRGERGMYHVLYVNYLNPYKPKFGGVTEQGYTSNKTDPKEIYKIDILKTFKDDVRKRLTQLEHEAKTLGLPMEDYEGIKLLKKMMGKGKIKVYKRPASEDYIWKRKPITK